MITREGAAQVKGDANPAKREEIEFCFSIVLIVEVKPND